MSHGRNPTTTTRTSTYRGKWRLLKRSIGVSAMHMALLPSDRIIMFDWTSFGPSNMTLPQTKCRVNSAFMSDDYFAHSVGFDPSNWAVRASPSSPTPGASQAPCPPMVTWSRPAASRPASESFVTFSHVRAATGLRIQTGLLPLVATLPTRFGPTGESLLSEEDWSFRTSLFRNPLFQNRIESFIDSVS